MLKNNVYYGEVWFDSNKSDKCFCVLDVIDGEIWLTTNLVDKEIYHRVDIIFGVFGGLGYTTFINCFISYQSFSIVTTIKYKPKYTLCCGYHHILPNESSINRFSFDNPSIKRWLVNYHVLDQYKNIFYKKDNIEESIKINNNLEVLLSNTTSYTTNPDFFKLSNIGYFTLNSQNKLSFSECIELYDIFQKFLIFFYGCSAHFSSMTFKCVSCDSEASLYYKSKISNSKRNGFLNIEYNKQNKVEIFNILKEWFNNSDFFECADIIITENLLPDNLSHTRRFINSYTAYEAYSSKYIAQPNEKPKMAQCFKKNTNLISEITTKNKEETDKFIKNIVRHRDYLTHRNKIKNKIFSEFQLLYISFLIDYIIAIDILKSINVSDKIIKVIINKAKRVYIDRQSMNNFINEDIIE